MTIVEYRMVTNYKLLFLLWAQKRACLGSIYAFQTQLSATTIFEVWAFFPLHVKNAGSGFFKIKKKNRSPKNLRDALRFRHVQNNDQPYGVHSHILDLTIHCEMTEAPL